MEPIYGFARPVIAQQQRPCLLAVLHVGRVREEGRDKISGEKSSSLIDDDESKAEEGGKDDSGNGTEGAIS